MDIIAGNPQTGRLNKLVKLHNPVRSYGPLIIPGASGGRLHEKLAHAWRHRRGDLEIRPALQVGHDVGEKLARVESRNLVAPGGRLVNRNVGYLSGHAKAFERFAIP